MSEQSNEIGDASWNELESLVSSARTSRIDVAAILVITRLIDISLARLP